MTNNVHTPLRYPGGKSKLAPYVRKLFVTNHLCDGHYVEPFAGGAGVALDLLFSEHAKYIHLNDLNFPVYAFWKSVLESPDSYCELIECCEMTVEKWRYHQSIVRNPTAHTLLEVGFSLFFLNRTNRSGIINAGVIGGLDQSGNYKMDARFKRADLIAKIENIASFKHRIFVYNEDASLFVKRIALELPEKSLIYLDPPYYVKGQRLYDNHYKKKDHAEIADIVKSISTPWMVSYDNVEPIRDLYSGYRQAVYDLHYSAHSPRTGSEVMVFSDLLKPCSSSLPNIAA